MHLSLCIALLCATSAVTAVAQPLTLRQALASALKNNPELAVATGEIHAAEGRVVQARLIPNPEAQFEVENFGAPGGGNATEAMETTLQLSQAIELGGKRRARTGAAHIELESARLDWEARRIELLKRTTLAFLETVALQQQAENERESIALAEKLLPEIRQRAEVGKASLIETSRSEMGYTNARLDLARTEGNLALAKQRLAFLMGRSAPAFTHVAGELFAPARPKVAAIEQTVEHEKARNEIRRREAQFRLEKANASPDLTLFAGPRWQNDTKSLVGVAGVGIPLPLWNRNQGAIREADARVKQAHNAASATNLRLQEAVAEARIALRNTEEEVAVLKSKIVPAAEASAAKMEEGYRAGSASALDLLETRRLLLETRNRLTHALAANHKAAAEIEALTAPILSQPSASR